MSSAGAGMSTPELLDIVDLGLTQHFLANDASSAAALLANQHCLVSTVKVTPRQRPSSAPVPPQGAPCGLDSSTLSG
eukprot:scaffold74443_cov54-Phaeocystis_antarctica.AAC.2